MAPSFAWPPPAEAPHAEDAERRPRCAFAAWPDDGDSAYIAFICITIADPIGDEFEKFEGGRPVKPTPATPLQFN